MVGSLPSAKSLMCLMRLLEDGTCLFTIDEGCRMANFSGALQSSSSINIALSHDHKIVCYDVCRHVENIRIGKAIKAGCVYHNLISIITKYKLNFVIPVRLAAYLVLIFLSLLFVLAHATLGKEPATMAAWTMGQELEYLL